jgi:hypothetical protein
LGAVDLPFRSDLLKAYEQRLVTPQYKGWQDNPDSSALRLTLQSQIILKTLLAAAMNIVAASA